MNVPTLPTDNLYKFMALSGLLLLIGSLAVPIWLTHVFTTKAIEGTKNADLITAQNKFVLQDLEKSSRKLNAIGVSTEELDQAVAQLEKDIDQRNAIVKLDRALAVIEKKKELVKKDYETYLEGLGTIEQKGRELKLKLIELKYERETASFLYADAKSALRYMIIGATIGVILTTTGFLLWYRKLQLYQDQFVRKEAGNVERPPDEAQPLVRTVGEKPRNSNPR